MDDKKPVDPTIIEKLRALLAKRGAPIATDINDMSGASKTDTPDDPNKNFAQGGVALPNANTPHKAPEGPSDAEKRELVQKALKEKTLKLDDGGIVGDVDASQLPLPVDAPQPSKYQAILQKLEMLAHSPAAKIAGAITNPIGAVSDAMTSQPVRDAASAALPAVSKVANTMSGGAIPDVAPPVAPAMPQDAPPLASAPAPMVPPPQQMKPAAPAHPAADPLAQLGKFDPTTVAPGMNPVDRQNLANQNIASQHTFGNYLAQAMSGIGDALAAKGGVNQNSLGDIFTLQKQQRDEALSNFDKAREMAVQNHTMKNQADQDLINNIKARGELLVSPDIARSIGHPEWANKPTAQVALALSSQKAVLDYTNNMMQRKQAALKDSADAVEHANKNGGVFGTQKAVDPNTYLKQVYTNAIRNDPEAFGYKISEAGK